MLMSERKLGVFFMSHHANRLAFSIVSYAFPALLTIAGLGPQASATTLSVLDSGGASTFSVAPGAQFDVGVYANSYSAIFAQPLEKV
jgi:hypothetical protein